MYEINLFLVEQEMELEFRYFKVLEGKNVTEKDRTINFTINYVDLYSVFYLYIENGNRYSSLDMTTYYCICLWGY